MTERERKLADLADDWGMTVDELLEYYFLKSLVPGICMNSYCCYTTAYEPDQREGWCDECQQQTVVSAMVLGNLI